MPSGVFPRVHMGDPSTSSGTSSPIICAMVFKKDSRDFFSVVFSKYEYFRDSFSKTMHRVREGGAVYMLDLLSESDSTRVNLSHVLSA